MNHGGAREGAGRKPEVDCPIRITTVVSTGSLGLLDQIAEEEGKGRSAIIREAIDLFIEVKTMEKENL